MLQATARTTLLLAFLIAIVQISYANNPPITNDECAGATSLTLGVTNTTGTVKGASASSGIPAGCATGNPDDDVWYSFTLSSITSVNVTLSGIGGNLTSSGAMVQIFSGSCGSLTSVSCGNTVATGLNLPIGTYYIRVYSFGTGNIASGADFSITVTGPPANDNCSGAVTLTSVLTCSSPTSGILDLASASTGLPAGCESVGTHYDVWYKFVASATNHTATISNLGTSFTNPEMQLYSGTTCGSLTSLQCGTTSVNSTTLTIGNTYYIRVSNIGSVLTGNGGFDICLTHPPPPPANDDCSSAVILTSSSGCSTTAGTLASATATTGLPSGCQSAGTHYDVWYKFVAASSTQSVTISNLGTNITSPELQIYSGTCGSLTSVQCGVNSLTATSLTSGNTYYVRVSNVGTAITSSAAFDICVTQPPTPATVGSGRMKEVYQQTILSGANILADPWEVTYGPDNYLWITEAKGYKAYRMDPNTGAKTTVIDISQGASGYLTPAEHTAFNVQFNTGQSPWPQGGFAGLALHPKFLDPVTPKNYVYISYVHKYDSASATTNGGEFFRNSVVRFTYNTSTGKLESPVALCDTLPGSSDHNSQRMIIAPVSGTYYLFYGQGDMGAGQFANQYRANKAQNSASYEGKILRFNLEPDGDAGALDKWIPSDNPFNGANQSAVWSLGIRNNQGFAYDTTTGLLYGSTHGPYSDDEINIIEKSKNYGHPLVIGYAADGNYNNSTAGSPNTTSSCPMITDEVAAAAAITNYKDPLYSAYAQSQSVIHNIWLTNPGNGGWPSEGWSGMDIYKNTLVPGWKNSIVISSLKWGRILRLKLGSSGTAVIPTNGTDTISYFGSQNRFRDVAFSPNGKDIFVVMERSTTSSGPSAANPVVPSCPGCVQKYTFLGYADAAGKSTIPDAIDVTDGTVNTCNTGTTITIDATNNNLWVPITGPDGNIMAEIYANGNNLGTVTSSFYKNSGSIRVKSGNHYLDRNMTITPQTQPSTAVKIRLYISKTEFDALDVDPLSGISAITDLKILKNSDACGNAISNATTLITPVYAEAHGTNGYMLQGSISGFSSFYFSSSNIALPVDLLTFSGSLQNNSTVLLKWETEHEINTSHFQVERSIDGSHFNSIGSVSATGNNNTGSVFDYSFPDADAVNQQSLLLYYRLKIIDRDGSYKYSNVITFSLADIMGNISVSPNPAVSEIKVTISSPADGKIQWKLIDNTGRVVLQNTEHVRKGNGNSFTINMEKLSRGSYYLSVSGAGIDQKINLQKL